MSPAPESGRRRVLVTGGASGIGAATLDWFVDNGDEVVAVDRVPVPAVTSSVQPVTWLVCDLRDPDAVSEVVADLSGSIDVVCNVAGLPGTHHPVDVITVNLLAVRQLSSGLAPTLGSGGSIVTVASTAGWYWRDRLEIIDELLECVSRSEVQEFVTRHGIDGGRAYELSKEAVITWTIDAARRWQPLGVRANTVSPGTVATPMLPAFYESMGTELLDELAARAGGRHGAPGDIANVIGFLASTSAQWVNGSDIVADNGAEAAMAVDAARASWDRAARTVP